MAQFFLGQIMMTGFGFATRGFALANGQLLPLNQNSALFSLLGVNYGGNGSTTFALPDLRSRTPVGQGSSVDSSWQPSPYVIGQAAGSENVTVLVTQLPQHIHSVTATTTVGSARGAGTVLAAQSATTLLLYGSGTPNTPLSPTTIGGAGNTQPHPNIQPYQTIAFQIATSGVYPSRN